MTITQLQIIISTAQEGSISGAARALGIPQSNASIGIKAIEKELGFDIFIRARGGIVPTEKGQLFLEHAQRILDENEKILELGEIEHIYQLRVGCTNYYRGRTSFLRLCTEHIDEAIADLQYYNVSIENGIRLLSEHKLDVVVGMTLDSLLPTIRELTDSRHLTCLEIADTYPVLSLRPEHPLITSGALDKGVDPNMLREYPYIAYHSLNADFEAPYYKAAFEVPCKYSLYVEERETRLNLVHQTDAFCLGGKLPDETVQQFGLVEYRYPGYELKVVCLYRDIDEDRPEVNRFIELVRSMD